MNHWDVIKQQSTLSIDPTLDRLLSALSATFFAFSGLFCFCALVLGLADNLEAGAVFGIASVGSIIVVVGVAFVRVVFCWPKLRTELAVASPYWNTRRARVQSSTHPGVLPSTDAVDRMAAVVDRVLAVITMAPSPRVGDRSTAAAPAPAAAQATCEPRLPRDEMASATSSTRASARLASRRPRWVRRRCAPLPTRCMRLQHDRAAHSSRRGAAGSCACLTGLRPLRFFLLF